MNSRSEQYRGYTIRLQGDAQGWRIASVNSDHHPSALNAPAFGFSSQQQALAMAKGLIDQSGCGNRPASELAVPASDPIEIGVTASILALIAQLSASGSPVWNLLARKPGKVQIK
jgi:hypothetical protein